MAASLRQCSHVSLPSCQRSLEEVTQSAYLACALGLLPSLRLAMLRGDELAKSDCVFDLGETKLVYEHDQGYYHGDVARDLKKTKKLLAGSQDILLVRLRIDAPVVDFPNHPNLVVVGCSKSLTPGQRLVLLAGALRGRLPPAFDARLQNAGPERRKVAEGRAVEIWADIYAPFKERVKRRHSLLVALGLQDTSLDPRDLVSIPLATIRTPSAAGR